MMDTTSNERSIEASVPEELDFADLLLERDPYTGDIRFEWKPIERICEVSCVDPAAMHKDKDLTLALIECWYTVHLARGGAHDEIADDLVAGTVFGRESIAALSRPVTADGIHPGDY